MGMHERATEATGVEGRFAGIFSATCVGCGCELAWYWRIPEGRVCATCAIDIRDLPASDGDEGGQTCFPTCDGYPPSDGDAQGNAYGDPT